MKKINIIFSIFFVMFNLSYSVEYSLNDIIEEFLSKGDITNIEKLNLDTLERKKKSIEKEKNSKIKLSLKNGNELLYNKELNIWRKDKRFLHGNLSLESSYRDFYIKFDDQYSNGNIDISGDTIYTNRYKNEISEISIGYNKNINDIFYSEYKYNKNNIKYEKIDIKLKKTKEKFEKIKELIQLYVEIKSKEEEKSLYFKMFRENKEMLKIVKGEYEVGKKREVDVEIINLELENIKNRIDILGEKVNVSKEKLLSYINKNGNKIRLLPLEKIDIGEIEVEHIEKEDIINRKNMLKEELKLLNRKNQVDINIYSEYDLKKNNYKLGINFTGEAFGYNYKIDENRNKNLEFEKLLKIKEKELIIKKTEEEKNYINLKKALRLSQKDVGIKFKINNLNKKLFIKGYAGASDYIKSKTNYIKAEVENKKNEYKLSKFMYEQYWIKKVNIMNEK
ncbi:TolC family protein [Haliovirga abyssi]|uniref:TolC family protein n=1 Tax=Haliovirga abyssi TaxID=2996794 RepID=A0AAU9DSA9_9FUSO|nr:TolC family protein [Haliovirga abyssi]BDU51508.1 hypothetical protein HLVA_20770 [Haliovirga abyssi]